MPGRELHPLKTPGFAWRTDPFAKIQFILAEAAALGMPALLMDTRHTERWVLLGSVDGDCEPHVREKLGAVSLIGREKFLACERLARRAGVLLGQAGSIETDQLCWIISETMFDTALERCNPAIAFLRDVLEFRASEGLVQPDGTPIAAWL